MTDAGISDLRRRRDALLASADQLENSVNADLETICMLLFYSAECALKTLMLQRQRARTTAALGDQRHHDLIRLAKDLKFSAPFAKKLQSLAACRTPDRSPVEVAKLHEHWRYGAKLEVGTEKRANEILRFVISKCKEG
ncbi:hypothetical protein [Glycomyces algeriensis]|uniref:HEPN domain-containing protein n=1 Tax=Glycomyces algeriensis TaxID=256037 RepID=A0A9W6G3J0_9ACTN|nr:hypothetical protein [Glycomyces algeriensis]MDA1366955.1 hypothetical protein [Glycomyces algeriensis]MDR7352659.1 hypothetical protein [Glycomyces algeriensis]GLI40340.1 hypothetical protein GALLR39Z86_01900 [Glycomyces algeriensis]